MCLPHNASLRLRQPWLCRHAGGSDDADDDHDNDTDLDDCTHEEEDAPNDDSPHHHHHFFVAVVDPTLCDRITTMVRVRGKASCRRDMSSKAVGA